MEAVKKTAACSTCEGRSYVVERRGELAAARACECSRPCKHCAGTGHVYTQRTQGARVYQVLAPCSCQILDARIEAYNRVGVPGVLAHARLQKDRFHTANAKQSRARDIAESFAQTYRRGVTDKGFILSGPVGSGKTHLLAATLAHLTLEGGREAQYIEISLLYATIRRGFQDGKSGGEIIQPMSEVEVLAIDELGKGRGSAFELETMDELVARRYNAGRVTLFATNYSLDPERKSVRVQHGNRTTEDLKRGARDSDLLRDRVGERIYSRLSEMCEFVEMPVETPDLRRTKHELESRGHAPRRA